MTRESRILLLMGLLAVLGVTSLVLIADRYRRLVERSAGAAGVVATSRDDDLRRMAAADLVVRFAAVRGAVKAAIDEQRGALGTADDADERYRRAVAAVRERKRAVLDNVGMSPKDYEHLRRAFVDWRAGDEVDPVLGREFDARRDKLQALDLGPLEDVDTAAPEA